MDIFDAIDDIHQAISSVIIEEQYLPPFVKEASLKFGELGRQDKDVWAWPEEKRFPLDTPNDIFWSYHYFNKTASKIPNTYLKEKIATALQDAIVLSGIPISFPKETSNISLPNSAFALRIKAASCSTSTLGKFKDFIRGSEVCMYPLDTPEQIKLANYHFPVGLDSELKAMRPLVAQTILEKVANTDIRPNPLLFNYVPMTYEAAVLELGGRAGMFPKFASAYNTAIEVLNPSMDKLQFCSAINALDKASGVVDYYGKTFKEASCFLQGIIPETFPSKSLLETVIIKKASYNVKTLPAIEHIVPGITIAENKQEILDNLHPSILNLAYSTLQTV